MARVGEQDYLAVLGVVREINEVGGRDEFDPVVLAGLSRLVASDVTTLNEVDPIAGRVLFSVEPASWVVPAGLAEVFAGVAHRHPLIRHHADSGDGSAIRVSDLLSRNDWRATEIYQQFFAPVGVEHQMSMTLPAPQPIVVGIALNREKHDFADRDRTVVNLVRPFVAQAWRRARDHDRVRALLAAASGALAESGSGVIVLDADTIHEVTDGALVSLYRFFGRPGPRDSLPARVRRWVDGQRQTNDELARPLQASLDGRQLVLRYLPGTAGQPEVLLLDERAAQAVVATLTGIGLTQREADVVRLVGTGASNPEIAAALSLSTWTVKRHLANVYTKLGVGNRVQLAAVAAEIDAHHAR